MALAVIAFVAATLGSDVFVQVAFGGQTIRSAIIDHLHWAILQGPITLILLIPFILSAAVASFVNEHREPRKAAALFAVSILCLIFVYLQGYRASHEAELAKHWTAATMSIVLLPFQSGPILLVTAAIGFLFVRKANKRGDDALR